MMSRSQWKRLWLWVFGILLIVLLFMFGDLSKLHELRNADFRLLGAAFLCTVGNISLTAWRWAVLVKTVHPFRAYPAGFFWRTTILGTTTGFLGLREVGMTAVKLGMLKTMTPVPLERAVLAYTLERFLDLSLILLLSAGSLGVFFKVLSLPVTSFGILGLMLLFIAASRLPASWNLVSIITHGYTLLLKLVSRLPVLAKRIFPAGAPAAPQPVARQTLALLSCLTAARFLILAVRPYYIARALQIEVPFALFLTAIPLSLLSLILSITPAGLGINDVTRYGIFTMLGLNPSDATLLIVGSRMFNMGSLILLFLFVHIAF